MSLSYLEQTNPNDHIYEYHECRFKLKFERRSSSLARIYFLNNDGRRIPRPQGLMCYDESNGEIVEYDNEECFIITWINNYRIYHNDVIIMLVTNLKRQTILMRDDCGRFISQ